MNTKDFIVLPWGKPGNSVKLKYKNSQELKMEKVQLELENKEMEKYLQEFQSTRRKEMEERQSSGYYWKSGQVGKLDNQSHMISKHKGNVMKPSGKIKLKLLKEQLQEPVKQLNYKITKTSESEKSMIKGKVCGQCENKAALLVCLECGEDYCSGCFAKIHQKGALKLHRTSLLQEKSRILSSVLGVAHQFIKEVNSNECKEHHFTKEISKNQDKPKSLLLQDKSSEVEISTAINTKYEICEEPSYKENSAQSFQECFNCWVNVQHNGNEKPNIQVTKPESQEVCEVQTDLKIWREPLKIEFKEDSLSYMEKLWLKKHRRTPQEQLRTMIPDTFIMPCKTTHEIQCSHNENNEDSDVEEKKMQHQSSFLPAEELNIERSEPTLTIIELNDTSEEEFGEMGNTVPYKVELGEADCRQSCTFHHYKNTFLCENDILHRYIFTKGKTDLLHLYLSSRFSYCKDYPKGTSNMDFNNIVYTGAYSPTIKKLEENKLFKRNLQDKCVSMEKKQSPDDSHILHETKDSLPSTDLTKPSTREELAEDSKKSLEFRNVYEKTNFEDSKTTESPLLLQKICPRNKPMTEQYQGREIFVDFDENERHNLFPSHSLECSYSSSGVTTAGDRKWIPDHSISTYADNAVALDVFQSAQNPSSSNNEKKKGNINQKTAILY